MTRRTLALLSLLLVTAVTVHLLRVDHGDDVVVAVVTVPAGTERRAVDVLLGNLTHGR